ncbi:MAG: hypothetical protein K9K67_12350 [Bacteriovoracaceae bacterium]|nr:hypothetical protein [Bacteriovoracaceae bacterium]
MKFSLLVMSLLFSVLVFADDCDGIDGVRYPTERALCEKLEKSNVGNCDNIDRVRYPTERALCEKLEISNGGNCDNIDGVRYPTEKELCEKLVKNNNDDLSQICLSDKGDGRVICNGKIYKLDTSIKYGGRRIGKEVKENTSDPIESLPTGAGERR